MANEFGAYDAFLMVCISVFLFAALQIVLSLGEMFDDWRKEKIELRSQRDERERIKTLQLDSLSEEDIRVLR